MTVRGVSMFKVSFPLQNTTIEVRPGTTVLAAEIAADIRPDAPCGGIGTCGKCRVDILSENGIGKWGMASLMPAELFKWRIIYAMSVTYM